jgi:glycosyltransferase involved in cell wall biosynthesis
VTKHACGGVVVANPSSTPEATHSAAALAKTGLLSRYHVPLATTPRQERRVGRLPGPVARPILRELRRRALPPAIPPDAARATATFADLRRVLATRLGRPQPARDRLAYRHRAAFDAAVARRLQATDGAIFAIAGAAQRTTARARGLLVPSAVDCPLGHHESVRSLMREEARINPEWAGTLQVHDFPDRLIEAHVEELNNADLLLVLSTYSRGTLLERGLDETRIVITPPGVDLELFRPGERVEDGVFRVLFVGQVTQRKGLSYLVDAFERAAVPGSELMLIGEVIGSPEPWVKRPGIRHLAPMPRAELAQQYPQADVFVLPSLAEGFGLTPLEAMASGVPAIVSTNTFADDVINDGEDGFVVPIRDADSIAERIRLLADDPDRRAAMGRAARRRAEQFPWSRYGQRIVELMRGVLRSSSSKPGTILRDE